MYIVHGNKSDVDISTWPKTSVCWNGDYVTVVFVVVVVVAALFGAEEVKSVTFILRDQIEIKTY